MVAFNPDSDDHLQRAIFALRADLPDSAPSSEVLERTADAIAELRSRSAPPAPVIWRRRAVAVAAAFAAVLLFAAFWVDGFSAHLAFGDVLSRIREAKQFSFRAQNFQAGDRKGEYKTFIRISEPDRARSEFTGPQGMTLIIRSGLQTVMIDEARRTVVTQKIPKGAFRSEKSAVDELQEAVEKDAKALGRKEVDGVVSEGFEAVIHDRKFVVWADARTGNPVRIECTPLGELAKWMPVQVLSDFKFDQHFPDELFSLKIPEGYDVAENKGWTPIEEIKRVLEVYAQRHDGRFPAELRHDDAGWLTALGIPEDRNARSPDQREIARTLDNSKLILKSYRTEIDYRYLAGAKLGDVGRPILWIAEPFVTGTVVTTVPSTQKVQKPELPKIDDADRKFTVLFADLHTEECTKKDLPAVLEGKKPD